jgi:hypothetical protein
MVFSGYVSSCRLECGHCILNPESHRLICLLPAHTRVYSYKMNRETTKRQYED